MQIFRRQTSMLGLDIGTSMIKAVKMLKKGDKYVLDNFAVVPIEEGAIQSGEIKNPSSLAQSAEDAVKKCSPNTRDVVVALPNFAILSDILTMDLRSAKELREAVMVEAEQIFSFDMTEVEINYDVLERDESTKKMKVLMVAAKNDIILSYIDFLNEAGLRPVVLDVEIFALANIFAINYDCNKYQNCIILNIGTDSTIAAFLQNGAYHSSRDISASGLNFQNEIKSIPNMTQEKIHKILRGTIDSEEDPKPIVNAINIAGKEFANAVSVAISYFQASDNVDKLDLIVLTGGYAWIPGLINMLELRTGTETIMLDPFINIEYSETLMSGMDTKKIGNVLSIAMGLATRTP